jgi:xanthine dehydrogenase accessory factor
MTQWQKAQACIARGETVARVTLTRVRGSAPREEGAAMLVTRDGLSGSIGGGTLEWLALAEAQRRMSQGPSRTTTSRALGPDLGQCCGGQVELLTEVFDASTFHNWSSETAQRPRTVFLFGAGHVGRALVLVLAQTQLAVTWVDPRKDAFPTATPLNVTAIQADNPEAILAQAPENSFVMVMSHSHALDLSIVDVALRNPNISETGLIGSATKRARFERRLKDMGHSPPAITRLICPIGVGGIRSKRPEAIAIATAAQLLALDERHQSDAASNPMKKASHCA